MGLSLDKKKQHVLLSHMDVDLVNAKKKKNGHGDFLFLLIL